SISRTEIDDAHISSPGDVVEEVATVREEARSAMCRLLRRVSRGHPYRVRAGSSRAPDWLHPVVRIEQDGAIRSPRTSSARQDARQWLCPLPRHHGASATRAGVETN